jgi:hypothetical protein
MTKYLSILFPSTKGMQFPMKSLMTGLALAAFAGASAVAAEAEIRPIAGGVTFRTDDNGTNPEYFRQRAAVFDWQSKQEGTVSVCGIVLDGTKNNPEGKSL